MGTSTEEKKNNTKKQQAKILELRNIMTVLKDLQACFKITLDQGEETVHELKDRSFEMIHSEEKKGKENFKKWQKPMGLLGHH